MKSNAEGATAADDAAELARQLEQVKRERDYLLVHSGNLEAELRHLQEAPASGTAPGFAQKPRHALRRLYRICRESGPWLMTRPFPRLRRTLRRLKS